MTRKTPPETPATTSRGNRATDDRMASNGDDYADDNNRSGEGNDASLTAGPEFVRTVDPDEAPARTGSCPHATGSRDRGTDADADDAQRDTPTQRD